MAPDSAGIRAHSVKNRIRALLAGAARHDALYFHFLRYVERCGQFVQREREWLKLRDAVVASEVADQILANLTVLNGPFEGLVYPSQNAMGSTLFPKLVGSYECELHSVFHDAISASYSEIVDIGCAEGYYAVGLALKIPCCRVSAFDTDEAALAACRKMAGRNGVSDRVSLGGFCGPVELLNLPLSRRALVISDCEGFEKTLFTRAVCHYLGYHDVLIEVHDFRDPRISASLRAAFADTHEIEVVRAIPDRLRADIFQFRELSGLSWETRTSLLAELRPTSMEWFFCRSRMHSRR